jgi:iron(III) transport system substrate-binding protein
LVEAARQEGSVLVNAPPGSVYRPAIVQAFEAAYPDIKVQATFGDGNTHYTRVSAERAAGKFLADVQIVGPGTMVTRMKPAGFVVPLRPALLLPEILDPALWLQKELWWADGAEPFTTLQFVGQVSTTAFYNTRLVNPAEFTSYWDFLDQRWKGRIVTTDLRTVGPGSTPATVMYKDPQVGHQFFARLFGEMDVRLSSDQRQMVDWVAQGQYPLGLFISGNEVKRASEQGLPIAAIAPEQFRERPVMSSGFGCVALLDGAPHPNAARLYVNWLLSRDGQIAWKRETKEASLRTDVPRAADLIFAPQEGFTYLNGSLEEYSSVTADNLRPLITEALQRAGRQ